MSATMTTTVLVPATAAATAFFAVFVAAFAATATAAALAVTFAVTFAVAFATAAAAFTVAVPVATAATALLVRVAVGDFIFARRPHRRQLDVKNQINAGQRMIGIQEHLVAVDLHHAHDRGKLIGPNAELVAGVKLALNGQQRLEHPLNLRRVMLAIGFGRGHLNGLLGANCHAAQRFIQPIDDLPGALQITDRLTARGGVEQTALGIAECIVKSDNVSAHS